MRRNSLKARILFGVLATVTLVGSSAAAASPQWLLSLQGLSLPDYPPETDAVVLLNEVRTEVTASGEIKSYYRIAYRILTPTGKNLAWVRLPFDAETKISHVKAWNLKPGGIVHEVTHKEAVETQLFEYALFADTKSLLLLIPQVDVGSVIGYEYERRRRPYILQDLRYFQGRHPVIRSRFVLELPSGWSYRDLALNHSGVSPRVAGENRWVWELENLPGIPEEEGMPPFSTLAAGLAVGYFPEREVARGKAYESWHDVARWFTGLMAPRVNPSGAITDTARRLGDRKALAEFVQKQIRYVAIEIGIGGYQPHLAHEVFRNKYGDCKDKVTLLKSLFQSLGLDLYPVLIHSGGRGLEPDFPSPLYFNHMIAAIPLSEEEPAGPAVLTHPELGRFLLFDPTDPRTPFGQLPSSLQGTKALLVRGDTGHVIETPVAPAAYNRLLRTGHFQLFPDGRLEGEMNEQYRGTSAARERSWLLRQTHDQWMRGAESFVARWLPGVRLEKFGVGYLEGRDMLTETYHLAAPYFGQTAGELLLFRPCVLGSKVYDLAARKERKYPFQFSHLRSQSDVFEISLPVGYIVEKLPEPVEFDLPFAHYRASVTQEGNILKYTRTLEIKQLTVPAEVVPALRDFYRSVDRDERAVAILRRQEGNGPLGKVEE